MTKAQGPPRICDQTPGFSSMNWWQPRDSRGKQRGRKRLMRPWSRELKIFFSSMYSTCCHTYCLVTGVYWLYIELSFMPTVSFKYRRKLASTTPTLPSVLSCLWQVPQCLLDCFTSSLISFRHPWFYVYIKFRILKCKQTCKIYLSDLLNLKWYTPNAEE